MRRLTKILLVAAIIGGAVWLNKTGRAPMPDAASATKRHPTPRSAIAPDDPTHPRQANANGNAPGAPYWSDHIAPDADSETVQPIAGNGEVLQPLSGNSAAPRRRAGREPPIFAQLRSSKDAPIPQCVRNLAEEITEGATNEVGKARAIYDWLTRNIVYDTAEWESIASGANYYIHEHDPESVLERGTTVCIGYAWLFDDLCEAAGIEATWLIGDVRGFRGTPDDDLVSDVRHAWNAVKLEDGEWHLLDATWGALQEGEAESAAWVSRADYYFDTPAGQFVYDHLPENEDWQLLETAVPSETAFSVLPNLKPAFFTNGLTLGEDYTSVLRAKAGRNAALSFDAPSGIQMAATLGPANGSGDFGRIRIVSSADGGQTAVIPELSPGEYILRLYSGKSSANLLECSADFLIRAE